MVFSSGLTSMVYCRGRECTFSVGNVSFGLRTNELIQGKHERLVSRLNEIVTFVRENQEKFIKLNRFLYWLQKPSKAKSIVTSVITMICYHRKQYTPFSMLPKDIIMMIGKIILGFL